MDIHSLTSANLKQAIVLLTKREALQARLTKLDEQIASLFEDAEPVVPSRKTTTRNGKTSPRASTYMSKSKKGRGALKTVILAALKAAGEDGVSIKDLAGKLGSKSTNLHAWFNATGKKMGNIKKIGRGVYRLEE